MFNMSDLSRDLESTEKPYTFPFKDTCLDSLALNSLEVLPRQNCVGKLTFLFFALKLKIIFPLTKKWLLSAW